MPKLLSIIVPSYNMEDYLPKCLGSLIVDDFETLQRLDVVVVNDGSKDRTSEIAHGFAAKHPDVFRVVDKPNGHYGSCINAALPLVRGAYVRILDADDYVDTAAFARFLTWLGGVDVDAAVTQFRYVDARGRALRHFRFAGELREGVSGPDGLDGAFWIPIHALAYNARVFAGGWYRQLEGICYTDCQWCTEPMFRVHSVGFFPQEVTCYLQGREGQSIDASVRVENIDEQMMVDLALAAIHHRGKPAETDDAVWRYFERLYYFELSLIYSIAFLGVEGHTFAEEKLRHFERRLQEADAAALEHVAVNVGLLGGLISYDLVKSYRTDSRCLFKVKVWLFRSYRALRRLFPIGQPEA